MSDLYAALAASLQGNPPPGAPAPGTPGAGVTAPPAPTLLQPGTGVDMNVFSVPPAVEGQPAPAAPSGAAPAIAPVPATPAAPTSTGVDAAALAQAVLAMQATQAQLTQIIQQQAAQPAAQPATPVAPPPLPALNSASLLSADEMTRFGDLTPALDRIVQQAVQNTAAHMQQHHIAPLQEQLMATAANLNTLQQSSSEQGSRAMTTMLNNAVPELAGIIHTPQWQARLRERLPLTGESVGDTLIRAYRAGDLEVVKAHVAEFKKATAPAPTPPMPAPAGSPGVTQHMHTPQAGVPMPAGSAPSAGVVDMARVEDLSRKYAAGQITPDAYNAMVAQVMSAAVSGATHVH